MQKLFARALVPLALLIACSSAPILRGDPPFQPQFAQEKSDLRPDTAVRFGKLPNGFRYALRQNHEPHDRTSLRLLVTSGALQENENQRGLAHFLEHMAFNGSTHFAPGTLVEFFQRLGMNFGGDSNAYTAFDRTVYMLELPDKNSKTLDDGLQVFSDFAGGLLLLDSEIDKERGIILSEKRARDSVEYRQFVAEYNFVLNGTRLPERMPIGLAPVIEKSKRDVFVDLYNTWYRPERMALVAVGDFDVDDLEKRVIAAFGTLTDRAPARPDAKLGTVSAFSGVRTQYHFEKEAPATTVSIQNLVPFPGEPDTRANRVKQLPRELAVSMLNRRLEILAKKENAVFTQGKVDVSEDYNFYRNADIQLACKPENWKPALTLAENELRRALTFGFTASELHEAVANLQNLLEQAVHTAPTRRSNEIADDLVHALNAGEVFTTPETDLAVYEPALRSIETPACVEALRQAFGASGFFVMVSGNAEIQDAAGQSPDAQIAAAFAQASQAKVTPPESDHDARFGYTDFGPAGKIADQRHVDDLDLTLVRYTNGVRLNLKKTDFEAGRIEINVRIGNGQLVEPRTEPGLALFSTTTFSTGGLGRHGVDELQRILAGKTVGLEFSVSSDALNFSAATNRDDFLLQMQLITAYITDPGFRPEAERLVKQKLEQIYNRLDHTPGGPLQVTVPRLLASDDPRFGLPTRAEISARTLAESRAWLASQFANGAIEIGVVGDLDQAAVLDAVAKTLGALPARAPKPALEAERKVAFPAKPFTKDFVVPTEIPKGVVALYWPTTDARDVRVVRRLRMLADVVSDRLRVEIREKLGASYSPDAFSNCSEAYRNYGFLSTRVVVDPTKTPEIAAAVAKIADDIVKNGVTEEELERAKKPVLTALRESARTNSYWLSAVLGSVQEFPERLDWCRSRYADNEAVTKADLDALAKTYLPNQHAFRVTVIPQPQNSSTPPGPPGSTK